MASLDYFVETDEENCNFTTYSSEIADDFVSINSWRFAGTEEEGKSLPSKYYLELMRLQ